MMNCKSPRFASAGSGEREPAILYTFRRCPYAIRARLALYASGAAVELREVALRDKPESMLAASPKGSVPVLVLPDGCVIDESWDIMLWALHQHDPESWMGKDNCYIEASIPLVIENDSVFKYRLDHYKYADRYPEHTQIHYRSEAEINMRQLEMRLQAKHFLLGDTLSIADVAIFPFIRQFAEVDKNWFSQAPYPSLQRWLKDMRDSKYFDAVMKKYAVWYPGLPTVMMPNKISMPIARPIC
jgi:glutathione S-transferase